MFISKLNLKKKAKRINTKKISKGKKGKRNLNVKELAIRSNYIDLSSHST